MRQEKLEFLSLWAINNDMELPRLLQQLERLKKRGIQGVVLRLRHYTNVPAFLSDEYMDIVNQVILRAKELDMSFWLYVENTLTRNSPANGWSLKTAGWKSKPNTPSIP